MGAALRDSDGKLSLTTRIMIAMGAGLVLGVIRGDTEGSMRNPNPWVEIPIQTHLPLSGEQGTETLYSIRNV